MTFTAQQIWQFFAGDGPNYTYEKWCEQFTANELSIPFEEPLFNNIKELTKLDKETGSRALFPIVMMDGGDSPFYRDAIVSTVNDVLAAVRAGYRVCTWHGPDSDDDDEDGAVIVVAHDLAKVNITDS